MANYCALADLQKVKTTVELARLADLDGDNAADAAVIERACKNATDLINGYISPRYTIPLATVPDLIQTIAVRLAIYYLYLDRSSLTDDINKQYDRDVEFLRRVGDGKASLGDPVNASDGAPAPGFKVVGADRVFTREKMEGF